jgi:hypothetical protein
MRWFMLEAKPWVYLSEPPSPWAHSKARVAHNSDPFVDHGTPWLVNGRSAHGVENTSYQTRMLEYESTH